MLVKKSAVCNQPLYFLYNLLSYIKYLIYRKLKDVLSLRTVEEEMTITLRLWTNVVLLVNKLHYEMFYFILGLEINF